MNVTESVKETVTTVSTASDVKRESDKCHTPIAYAISVSTPWDCRGSSVVFSRSVVIRWCAFAFLISDISCSLSFHVNAVISVSPSIWCRILPSWEIIWTFFSMQLIASFFGRFFRVHKGRESVRLSTSPSPAVAHRHASIHWQHHMIYIWRVGMRDTHCRWHCKHLMSLVLLIRSSRRHPFLRSLLCKLLEMEQ